MHFNKANWVQPCIFKYLTASLISFSEASPADIITGFLICAIRFGNGKWLFSNEATLYNGTFKLSKKSTAVWSKGLLK